MRAELLSERSDESLAELRSRLCWLPRIGFHGLSSRQAPCFRALFPWFGYAIGLPCSDSAAAFQAFVRWWTCSRSASRWISGSTCSWVWCRGDRPGWSRFLSAAVTVWTRLWCLRGN